MELISNVTSGPSNNFLGNCNGIRTVLMIWVSVASNFSFNTVLLTDTQYDVSWRYVSNYCGIECNKISKYCAENVNKQNKVKKYN